MLNLKSPVLSFLFCFVLFFFVFFFLVFFKKASCFFFVLTFVIFVQKLHFFYIYYLKPSDARYVVPRNLFGFCLLYFLVYILPVYTYRPECLFHSLFFFFLTVFLFQHFLYNRLSLGLHFHLLSNISEPTPPSSFSPITSALHLPQLRRDFP